MSRMLVSPPTWLDVHYLLNHWMGLHDDFDRDRAVLQWRGLVDALVSAGAEVQVMDPFPEAPALAFTRDACLPLDSTTAVLLANDGPRGSIEPLLVRRWLRRQGIDVIGLHRVDGGNVVHRHGGGWLIGAKVGVDGAAERTLATILTEHTGEPVHCVPLVTDRYPHLDMALADLAGRGWLAYPTALAGDLTSPAWRAILGDRPVVELSTREAEHLAANVVTVGTTVVGDLPESLIPRIEALGLDVISVDLSDLRMAGGAAHCLTAELHAALSRSRRQTRSSSRSRLHRTHGNGRGVALAADHRQSVRCPNAEDSGEGRVIDAADRGIALRVAGRYEEAIETLTAALTGAHTAGDSPDLVGRISNELGMACKYAGHFAQGRPHLDRALEIFTELHGDPSRPVASVCHNIGGLLHTAQRSDEAEPWARRAVTNRTACNGPDEKVIADRAALAPILTDLGRLDEAEAILNEVLGFYEAERGPDDVEVAVTIGNLAAVNAKRGRPQDAIAQLERALDIKTRILGPDHPSTELTSVNLVQVTRAGVNPSSSTTACSW